MQGNDWNDDDRRRGGGPMGNRGQFHEPGRGGWEDDSWRTGAQREPRGRRGNDRGMTDRGIYGQDYGGRGYSGQGGYGGYDEGLHARRGDSAGPMGAGGYRSGWDDDDRSGYARGRGHGGRGDWGDDDRGPWGDGGRGFGGDHRGSHGSGYYGAQGSREDYGGRYSGRGGRGDYGGGYGLGQNYGGRYGGSGLSEMDSPGHRGRGPKGYARSDDRIREDVSDRLSDDDWLDASEIEVSVSKGEVTLSGTVDSRQAKRHAEDCADAVSGVNHVQNNLRVHSSGSRQGGSQSGSSSGGQTRTTGG